MLRTCHNRQALRRSACSGARPFTGPSSHIVRARSSKTPESKAPEPESTSANEPSSTQTPAASEAGPRITKEWTSLGSKVIETNQPFDGPENQKDFWEGENFEAFGKLIERYFLPTLVVLGLICGGIAARTYNDGAETYIKPPSSPDEEASIIVAIPQGQDDSSSVVAPDTSI